MSRVLPKAENVHRAFRGTAEYSKLLYCVATVLDVVAGLFALVGIFHEHRGWIPFLVLVLAFLSLGARIWSDKVEGMARRWWTVAVQALAHEVDVDARVESAVDNDKPWLCDRLAGRLPATSLAEYFEPVCEPGEARLREMYAHASFYTWRIARRYAWLLLWATLLMGGIAAAVFFDLALSPTPQAQTRDEVLEALCSVVLVLFFFRAVEATVSTAFLAKDSREVADELIEDGASGAALIELTRRYDDARHGSPYLPTWLYRSMRSNLSRLWTRRREAICRT